MICPIRLREGPPHQEYFGTAECIEKGCAWWYNNRCSINAIAECVDSIDSDVIDIETLLLNKLREEISHTTITIPETHGAIYPRPLRKKEKGVGEVPFGDNPIPTPEVK